MWVLDSVILNDKPKYLHHINEWLPDKSFKWRLCYRASLDGWEPKNFHSKCDNKGPTVLLVQVGNFVFGGFTDESWSEIPLSQGNEWEF